MAAHALGAAAYAVKEVALANPDRPDAVSDEMRWQRAELTQRERDGLRLLPPIGVDDAGPLGPGLLSRGVLGSEIRELQSRLV